MQSKDLGMLNFTVRWRHVWGPWNKQYNNKWDIEIFILLAGKKFNLLVGWGNKKLSWNSVTVNKPICYFRCWFKKMQYAYRLWLPVWLTVVLFKFNNIIACFFMVILVLLNLGYKIKYPTPSKLNLANIPMYRPCNFNIANGNTSKQCNVKLFNTN